MKYLEKLEASVAGISVTPKIIVEHLQYLITAENCSLYSYIKDRQLVVLLLIPDPLSLFTVNRSVLPELHALHIANYIL